MLNKQSPASTSSNTDVHYTHSSGHGNKRFCLRCGNSSHLADKCKHIDSICGSCSRQGHLSRVCKASQSQRPPHTQTYSHQSFGKLQSSHKNKKKFHKKGKQRNKVHNITVSSESSEENVDDLSDVLAHLFSMPE